MAIDRTRQFRLPGIHELSKDQDEALALPLHGQHLIVGGPGTGKSVVSLLRARRLAQAEQGYLFLVYNRLLDQSNKHLFGSNQPFFARTWDAWLREFWRRLFSESIPTRAPEGTSTYRPIDWDAVLEKTQTLQADSKLPDDIPLLVIDEGQDMPPNFYETLAQLAFEGFYVAADQNQQLHPDRCSSRQELEDNLAIDSADVINLTTNYRNVLPVAILARHFYTGDRASPPPELPDRQSAFTPILVPYNQNGKRPFARIIDHILQLSDRNPRKLIGIVCPNNTIRTKFFNSLTKQTPRLDNGRPPIQTYFSGQQETMDFGHGGIIVINAHSCKGLEFDIVFLADIDAHQPKDRYTLQARFYVMVSRARERIIMLRTGEKCPVVSDLLPDDPAILAEK